MPSSMMSSTRIITILSLVALSILSFTVLFGYHNNLDTLTRDTLAHDSPFSLPKGNVVHKRRALHHARATTPVASESSPAASQSAPTQASSPAPFSSPSPSSSSQPSPTQVNSSPAPSQSRATSSSPGTSAASSSASPSSTLSSSSSFSSNARASSSSPGVTSSTVGATSNIDNNPTTTFVNHPVSHTSGLSGTRPTNPGSTVSVGATPSVGATSGFFNNKAAVGATFSIIGILGGLAVIMAVLAIMKRRRRARGRYAIEDEEFFEKYPSHDLNEPVPHIPPGFGTGSAEASITDFNMSAAPADAYPDRAIHYANNNSTPAIGNGNTHEESGSEYSVPSASHPFADPANTSGLTAAPPVKYPRSIPGRAQEMVTTDSYYGPNSAGLGAGGVGFAQ